MLWWMILTDIFFIVINFASGVIMRLAGYNANTWQRWVVLVCLIVLHIVIRILLTYQSYVNRIRKALKEIMKSKKRYDFKMLTGRGQAQIIVDEKKITINSFELLSGCETKREETEYRNINDAARYLAKLGIYGEVIKNV